MPELDKDKTTQLFADLFYSLEENPWVTVVKNTLAFALRREDLAVDNNVVKRNDAVKHVKKYLEYFF